MRFFFDYRGDEFKSFQSAMEYAQTALQNLSNSLSGDWVGWSVEVWDAGGMKFCSLPVDASEVTTS